MMYSFRKGGWLLFLGTLAFGMMLGVAGERLRFDRWDVSSGSRFVEVTSVTGTGQQAPRGVAKEVEFKRFWELWQLLKEKYYQQPVKDVDLFYGAMSGLANSLRDPYTAYFNPKSAQEFQQSLSGKFEGIGAEIGIKNEQLQIVAPLPETPAERAGLWAGDLILKINGQDTAGMGIEKAVSLIRGPKGTQVTLVIFRTTQKTPPKEVVITRDEIRLVSVRWKMLPQQIAFVEVAHFNGDTKERFEEAVQFVLRKDAKGLILDLRNNPGGFLDTSLSMAGEWVGNQVVVKERRQGKIVETLLGSGGSRLRDVPTVVLVNQGSASASEIVAGALQDYGKAKIVGMKTFGKGSVQDYQTLSDGSGIKITIAEWFTPRERTIHQTGLNPDVVVDRTQADYETKHDPQLDRAVAILDNGSSSSGQTTSTRN